MANELQIYQPSAASRDARIVTEEEVRAVDADLSSLRNCNTPEAYTQALKDAGLYTPGTHEPANESD